MTRFPLETRSFVGAFVNDIPLFLRNLESIWEQHMQIRREIVVLLTPYSKKTSQNCEHKVQNTVIAGNSIFKRRSSISSTFRGAFKPLICSVSHQTSYSDTILCVLALLQLSLETLTWIQRTKASKSSISSTEAKKI